MFTELQGPGANCRHRVVRVSLGSLAHPLELGRLTGEEPAPPAGRAGAPSVVVHIRNHGKGSTGLSRRALAEGAAGKVRGCSAGRAGGIWLPPPEEMPGTPSQGDCSRGNQTRSRYARKTSTPPPTPLLQGAPEREGEKALAPLPLLERSFDPRLGVLDWPGLSFNNSECLKYVQISLS